MTRRLRHLIGLGIGVVVLVLTIWIVNRRRGQVTCGVGLTGLVADCDRHELIQCERGRVLGRHSIRIGKRGIGKRQEGDGKTPIGVYELSTPRHSKKYGVFIPIGYPTKEQRAGGYTGGDVGIHGPDRRVRWLGPMVNAMDTTDGCLGIASDEEMDRIAEWVNKHSIRTIEIRGE